MFPSTEVLTQDMTLNISSTFRSTNEFSLFFLRNHHSFETSVLLRMSKQGQVVS